ncbi:MAG TPA: hypothetical protein VK569_08315 [Bacteroidota bacterium]|nr:hypothetical protein [Bacteroidota bacterium]
MTIRESVLILAVVSCAAAARGGGNPSSVVFRDRAPDVKLSGNARIDFTAVTEFPAIFQGISSDSSAASLKSPWIAGGLSLLLPGAGEFYTESYVKSAIFLAVEVGLWAFAYKYDQKGDRQTDYFQDYANAHWSVVNYAQYALDHYAPAGGNYHPIIPGTEGNPPWLRVNWAELNRMEADIGATPAGMYYSHLLPAYNTQQYYELIGKYPQFNQGWSDAPPSFTYGDPLSSELLYYSGQRGQANTYYTTASTFVSIALLNHVVSAVDAALSAGSYNRGLHASVGSQTVPVQGGYATVPVLRLAWGL